MRRTVFALLAVSLLCGACMSPVSIPRLPEDREDERDDESTGMNRSVQLPEGLIILA